MLAIEDFEEAEYHLPRHSHNYYEIIYIYKGCGLHHLNETVLPYQAGDLFLLAPEDRHYFQIRKSTRFVFIKFTDHYFNSKRYVSPDELLMSDPAELMRHKVLKESKLVFGDGCKTILRNTIENILAYNCRKDVAASPIVFFQILSILGVVREGLTRLNAHMAGNQPNKDMLISHIHQHIYEPAQIQIKQIATQFNIAPTYFSAYFKRDFGISYRDYINNLRLTLIEKRIVQGRQNLKEIAAEFGFTDQSHLSHFIKKKLNATPGHYRQQHHA